MNELLLELVDYIIPKIPVIYIKQLNQLNKAYNKQFSPILWKKLGRFPPFEVLEKYGPCIKIYRLKVIRKLDLILEYCPNIRGVQWLKMEFHSTH
jgi:hypothetical protein